MTPGVKLHDMLTVSLNKAGTIDHVVNDVGAPVTPDFQGPSYVVSYPAPVESSMASLPIFPLGGTLMPGMQLPLQIFEERYLALLRHLIDSEGEELGFGVVAIRHGYEVGDRANELYAVGCLAVLDRVVQVTGGLFLVLSHGTRRFRLDAVDESAGTPWMTGEVSWLDDQVG